MFVRKHKVSEDPTHLRKISLLKLKKKTKENSLEFSL